MTANRAFFLIDPQGIVRRKWIIENPMTTVVYSEVSCATSGRSWESADDDAAPSRGHCSWIAVWTAASAEQPAVTALLKHLDLVGYRSPTDPPHFSGPTLDARQLSLTDLRGKVVVVNFWASWCAECRPEMPVLEGLHRELAARGLAIVGINARENKQAVGRYAAELGLTFPLVLDPEGKTNNALWRGWTSHDVRHRSRWACRGVRRGAS